PGTGEAVRRSADPGLPRPRPGRCVPHHRPADRQYAGRRNPHPGRGPVMSLFPKQSPGSVLLIGAGPGDLGMLTVTGLRGLESADVIVAARLGARSVINQLETERGRPLDAEIIDVGKHP